MQMIAEAASGWSEHASVTIPERDRHDAINVTAHGIVTVEGGVEHRFIVDDGNPARLRPQQPKSYCQGSLPPDVPRTNPVDQFDIGVFYAFRVRYIKFICFQAVHITT